MLRERFTVPKRRACTLVGISCTTLRYDRRVPPDEERLRQRMRELAAQRRRFGYRRLHVRLRREGWRVNHKRVAPVYRQPFLAVDRRACNRPAQPRADGRAVPAAPNEQWSLDFVGDRMAGGRRIRLLTVLDTFPCEALAFEVDTSLAGARDVEVLDRLVTALGEPCAIVIDSGPELTSRVLDQWAYEWGVRVYFIAH